MPDLVGVPRRQSTGRQRQHDKVNSASGATGDGITDHNLGRNESHHVQRAAETRHADSVQQTLERRIERTILARAKVHRQARNVSQRPQLNVTAYRNDKQHLLFHAAAASCMLHAAGGRWRINNGRDSTRDESPPLAPSQRKKLQHVTC